MRTALFKNSNDLDHNPYSSEMMSTMSDISHLSMTEPQLNAWWKDYLQHFNSSAKKFSPRSIEELEWVRQKYQQELEHLFNTHVVRPLLDHDVVQETQIKTLCSILENCALGRDILWSLRDTIYKQLIGIVEKTQLKLTFGENVISKLHVCIRAILKMEQCHYENWTRERKGQVDETLTQNIKFTLLDVVSNPNCPADICLLAGTAFGFFLHSFCDIRKGVDLFISALYKTEDRQSSGDISEQFRTISLNNFIGEMPIIDEDASSVFLLHGILSCGKTDILLKLCDGSQQPFVINIFPLILHLCEKTKQYVYHTFCSLVAWLKFTMKYLDQLCEQLKGMSPGKGPALLLKIDAMSSIVGVLNVNWNNPIVGVHGLVWNAYELLLEIHTTQVKLLCGCDESKNSFIDELFDQTMCQPWTVKNKYPPLAILVPYIGLEKILSKYSSFVEDLSESLSSNTISSAGGEVYLAFLRQLRKEVIIEVDLLEKWKIIFLKPLLAALKQKNRIVHWNAIRHMLTPTLKLFPFIFDELHSHIEIQDNSTHLLVTILRLSRYYGIRNLNENDFHLLQTCLINIDEDIREEAFATICTCSRKAEPLASLEMDLIKDFLCLNMNVDSASFRQQLICNFKLVLVRLRNSCLSWLSTVNKNGASHPNSQLLDGAMEFLDYCLRLVLKNLSPGGCYQRRQTCLLLLKSMLEAFCIVGVHSGRRKGIIPARTSELLIHFGQHEKCQFLSSNVQYVLQGCILDYMDEIKNLALYLLSNYFPRDVNFTFHEGAGKDMLCWAFQLSCNPKTTSSQSGAAFFHFLFTRVGVDDQVLLLQKFHCELRKQYSIAKENFLQAAKAAPMHGLLSALSRVFGECDLLMAIPSNLRESVKSVLRECIHLACDIITHIQNVLGAKAFSDGDSVNAPSFADIGEAIEDILQMSAPDGSFEINSGTSFEHQLILACYWLSLKEGCLFLGKVVHSLPLEQLSSQEDYLIHFEEIVRIRDTLVSVLLKCRHRGVIEACNLGFELFCQRLSRSLDHRYVSIIHSILKNALDDVAILATLTSITRRSAGLPLLIQTVAGSEHVGQQKLLTEALTFLLKLAGEPLPLLLNEMVDLPQARALHILRALVHDSRFSQDILGFLDEIVIASLDSFISPLWAVRNAGLQLYGSVIPRLLGQKKISEDESGHNRIACDEFFARWPKLHRFLIMELEKVNPLDPQPTVLPILSLLGRLAPITNAESCARLESIKIVGLVWPFLGCPIWHVRQMAASAVAALSIYDNKAQCFLRLTDSLLANGKGCNRVHGYFLVLKALVENIDTSLGMDDRDCFYKGLQNCFLIISSLAKCPILQAVGMDVILAAPSSWYQLKFFNIAQVEVLSTSDPNFWEKLTYWKLLMCAPESNLLIIKNILHGNGQMKYSEFEGCFKYLRDILERDDHLSLQFWTDVQNSLCHCARTIKLSGLLLNCVQLILDICTHLAILPSVDHFDDLQVLSLLMASKCYGASIAASSAALWAIAIKVKLQENTTLLDDLCSSSLEPWTRLLHSHCSPQLSEPFRLYAAKALTLCGFDIMDTFVKMDMQCLSLSLSASILRIFDVVFVLLQDEQLDVRKEASKFVSAICLKNTDCKMESVHSNMAIKLLGNYVAEHFWEIMELPVFFWEKINCKDQFEFLVLTQANKEEQPIALFEQEDINVYAERCFMSRCYMDILKQLIIKDASKFRLIFSCARVEILLNSVKKINAWLQSQTKPVIGCLEIVTQTRFAHHLCNLCAQMELLHSFAECEKSGGCREIFSLYQELRDLIGYTW